MSPWDGLPRASCLPHDCGCEIVDTAAFIAQPSAFWSSLSYLIVTFLFFRSSSRKDEKALLWFASLFLLALGSLLNHGTFLRVAAAIDFAGIVLAISYFSIYTASSRIKLGIGWCSGLLFSFFLFVVCIFYALEKSQTIAICALALGIEIAILGRTTGLRVFQDRDFIFAISSLLFSLVFFLVDEHKILCNPSGWLTPHSIWHLGTAISLNCYGRFKLRQDLDGRCP